MQHLNPLEAVRQQRLAPVATEPRAEGRKVTFTAAVRFAMGVEFR